MAAVSGGLFHSAEQELLLKAALFSGKPMLDAWQAWRQKVDFEKEVDHGSLRLLPLLYHNLHQHKINDPLLQRLKGIYRKAWSNNQILLQEAGQVIGLLNETAIPNMVLNGIPLTLMVYKNHAVRPIKNVDIMVPFTCIRSAIDLLSDHGWNMQEPYYLEYFLRFGKSIVFVSTEKTKLRLHWHPIIEMDKHDIEPGFRDMAVPIEVAGSETYTLCETDAFIHTIFHGIWQTNELQVSWLPDAMALIKQHDRPVNWERFIRWVCHFRIGPHSNKALTYLHQTFSAPIPKEIFRELSKIKPRISGQLIYWHDKRSGNKYPSGILGKLIAMYINYIRRVSRKNSLMVQIGFLKYLYLFVKEKSLSVLIKNNILQASKENRA